MDIKMNHLLAVFLGAFGFYAIFFANEAFLSIFKIIPGIGNWIASFGGSPVGAGIAAVILFGIAIPMFGLHVQSPTGSK